METSRRSAEKTEWIVGVHNMSEEYFKEVEEKIGNTENVSLFSLNEPTKTLGAIRNVLLERAQGTYLFWLDSDDELTPECIRHAVEVMEKGNADMVMFSFREEAEEGAWYVSRKANLRETEPCVYEKKDPRMRPIFCAPFTGRKRSRRLRFPIFPKWILRRKRKRGSKGIGTLKP